MKYGYLTDYEFLKSIDFLNIQTTFVRINILNKKDLLVAGIEGRATGGNINLNGSSAVRRTGSLTMVADEDTYRITDVQNLISINKRIEVEIGIKNLLKQAGSYIEKARFYHKKVEVYYIKNMDFESLKKYINKL